MNDQVPDSLQVLEEKLGYIFRDRELLRTAVRHSSFVHENPGCGDSNERLEFLGDAVLELIVTDLLYQKHPDASEGHLSRARSGIVNEGRLARTAQDLDVGGHLLLGKGERIQMGHQRPSLLADAMEAITAAVYLDGGLEASRELLERLLSEAVERASVGLPRKDYKTRLQEKVQEELHVTPRYRMLAAEGPDHRKLFKVELTIDGEAVAQGSGHSKKEAEQEAARQGLLWWEARLGQE